MSARAAFRYRDSHGVVHAFTWGNDCLAWETFTANHNHLPRVTQYHVPTCVWCVANLLPSCIQLLPDELALMA